MRPCLMLTVAALAVIVSACSRTDAPVVRTVLIRPDVPASARERCSDPAAIPDRSLAQREVTSLWGRDRVSLRECEARRAAAVRSIDNLKPE